MDALQFFRLRYDHAHRLAEEFRELTAEQLRARPHGLNSVAWLVWHMARVEDVAVNRFVVDRPQVHAEEGWASRLNVPRRDVGTGMSSPEVDELSASVDLDALWAYWRAVGQRTLAVVGGLRPEALDVPTDPDRVRRIVADEELAAPAAGMSLAEFWAGQPNCGWFLSHPALTHLYGHIYEGWVTRSLVTGVWRP